MLGWGLLTLPGLSRFPEPVGSLPIPIQRPNVLFIFNVSIRKIKKMILSLLNPRNINTGYDL